MHMSCRARRAAAALSAACLLLPLGACGQKGPLYLTGPDCASTPASHAVPAAHCRKASAP